MAQRTAQQRLDAIPAAVASHEAFKRRLAAAEGDATACADLMAEAIQMAVDANGKEVVGRSGKVTVCMEDLVARWCEIDARKAYLRTTGKESG